MRVFVTGATGFIGSAVVKELIGAGHQVIGVYRSDDKAPALAAAGAEVYRGSIDDPESLKDGAVRSDGVIHLAFNHDFSQFAANCETDRRVIAALGSALAGSDRPLIVTSGTAIAKVAPGQVATEDAPSITSSDFPRAISEEATADVAADGVNTSVVRLPQVHDPERQGLISPWIALAREKGAIAYIGEGRNRWAAAHISDVARLYRLAIEKSERGAVYNAVGEEGVSARDIAETIARRLKMPVKSVPMEEAGGYFGWLAHLAARDMPASSALTQKKLGWRPTGPGLIADLERLPVSSR
jgi:nucleoside-diphosphate-sugar epimerase